MKALIWLLVLGILAGLGYWMWLSSRRWAERKRASEERFASFMAQTMRPAAPRLDPLPAAAPAPAAPAPAAPAPAAVPAPAAPGADPQRLLFEAAVKAGEAGEPALAIQLYARLIARFPQAPLAAQARAAVEAQKAKLARP